MDDSVDDDVPLAPCSDTVLGIHCVGDAVCEWYMQTDLIGSRYRLLNQDENFDCFSLTVLRDGSSVLGGVLDVHGQLRSLYLHIAELKAADDASPQTCPSEPVTQREESPRDRFDASCQADSLKAECDGKTCQEVLDEILAARNELYEEIGTSTPP